MPTNNVTDKKMTKTFEKQMGITGIPTFVVDGGRAVLSGAVHSDELLKIFREIEAEAVAEAVHDTGPQDAPPDRSPSTTAKHATAAATDSQSVTSPVFAPLLVHAFEGQ